MVARPTAAEVKDADHTEDDGEARAGTDLVPMGGDKECHATGQKDCAEDKCDQSLPLQTGGALLLRFPCADAACCHRIQDAG